jgi:hypothetical protein
VSSTSETLSSTCSISPSPASLDFLLHPHHLLASPYPHIPGHLHCLCRYLTIHPCWSKPPLMLLLANLYLPRPRTVSTPSPILLLPVYQLLALTMSASLPDFPRLSDSNYNEWKVNMKASLQALGVWHVVTGERVKPAVDSPGLVS